MHLMNQIGYLMLNSMFPYKSNFGGEADGETIQYIVMDAKMC